MAGRPGFFGGSSQDDASQAEPGFDPVWGTLGAPEAQANDPWLAKTEDEEDGRVVEAEVFGSGFQISGQLRTGQFDRLSDWLNMQTGFIRVSEASLVHLGSSGRPDADNSRGVMWVRVDQIVLIAECSSAQTERPGAPMVQKQRRRVTVVTPGFRLRGSMHVHAYGSMKQFLETPDPHFLPMTDVTLRWLTDDTLISHFPFAMVNREQLITVIDEASDTGASAEGENEAPLSREGAA